MTDTQTTSTIKEQFASDIFWPNFARDAKIDQRIVALYFSNIPPYWIPLLWPFENSFPERYYTEETYQLVLTLLADAYDADMGYCEKCLTYFANELDAAYANYRRVTQLIHDLPTPQIGRERRFRQYIFPLYQELIEAVWRPLARFCVIALEKPADTDFDKYAGYTINVLECKLENKHSKFEILLGFNRILRNNIAHHKFEFSDDVMKQHVVVLHDPAIDELSDDEIDDLLTELYDCCSAMLYGILRYSAVHEHQFTAIPFGHYIREQIIAHAIQEKRISLEKSTFVTTTTGVYQRNVEIRYYYPNDARVLMLLLSTLKLVVRFLPSDEYFIVIKPRKGAQYIWIQTPHNRAQAFVENRLSLHDYLKTGDVQMFKDCTKPPKVPAILRLSALLLPNMIHVLRNELRSVRGWSLIKEEPFSTGTQARYRLYLVQHRDLSQEEATRIIKKVIRKKRALVKSVVLALWDILRSFIKRTPARPPVTVILVMLWRKEKRISQMALDPQQGHDRCVCCAEWKQAPPFLWLRPTDSDEKTENFVLRWFG